MNKQENLDNFKKMADDGESDLLEILKWRKANEKWLDTFFQVPLGVLRSMRKQNITQKIWRNVCK